MSQSKFDELVDLMKRLRGESGCPWDREQTHKTLRKYLLEEAYEIIETIDEEKWNELKEELGDLLLHVVFHSQIASERGEFKISDVLDSIIDKIKRRHPHVFGNVKVKGSEDVRRNWEEIKYNEGRRSRLDGVPRELSALLRARRLQMKAAEVGFDWEKESDVWSKVEEELGEFKTACKSGIPEKMEEELGDLLFSLVNLSRFIDVNPEDALRKTVTKFVARFKKIEEELEKEGKKPEDVSLEEMDHIWERSKID
ncbi:MAG: nucleoside triphosphate pyrophosphohydrolase [Fidelibacterota bacterium]